MRIIWNLSLQEQRAQNFPTIPSTIQEELEFNPFMRVEWVLIRKQMKLADLHMHNYKTLTIVSLFLENDTCT